MRRTCPRRSSSRALKANPGEPGLYASNAEAAYFLMGTVRTPLPPPRRRLLLRSCPPACRRHQSPHRHPTSESLMSRKLKEFLELPAESARRRLRTEVSMPASSGSTGPLACCPGSVWRHRPHSEPTAETAVEAELP